MLVEIHMRIRKSYFCKKVQNSKVRNWKYPWKLFVKFWLLGCCFLLTNGKALIRILFSNSLVSSILQPCVWCWWRKGGQNSEGGCVVPSSSPFVESCYGRRHSGNWQATGLEVAGWRTERTDCQVSNSEESHINLLPFLSYTVLKKGEGKR